ncbi:MAG: polysaccharide deacetylase [Alphaproteobacteria bacterium CG_4_9_14_3_um_filter_47_13]|nr:MAG: polysaccharide deacetylase [Alphaproteobacteria bacterium CG_4_9_14_3_um_filter_47_13]
MKRHVLQFSLCVFLSLVTFPAMAQAIPQDQNAAVIFVYHRIGEDEYPETSIRREQFISHINELVSGDYNVITMTDLITTFKNREKLPEYTVAITFDGGHKSVLENAVPLLEKNNLPYTLFISTDNIDLPSDSYMNWSEIKTLSRSRLVDIGLHPAAYIRLHDQPDHEIMRQLNNARTRFRNELGKEATVFAYPFGEYSNAYRNIIETQGFKAAVGQQSGVAYSGADIFALPRFPMTESYGGLDRFRLAANALPLPVTDIEPSDSFLTSAQPSIGFTVTNDLKEQLENISCFVSGQKKPEIEIIGKNRVELRLAKAFEQERARINCTLPLPTTGESYEEPRWRWFGLQMIIPKDIAQSWE